MATMDGKTPDPKTAADDAAADKAVRPVDYPAAGPHARPDLNDAEKTPGAGMLSDPSPHDTDAPGG